MISMLRKPATWFLMGIVLIVLTVGLPKQLAAAPVPVYIAQGTVQSEIGKGLSANPAQLPPLPYAYDALEKAIDAETMKIHHDRHHKAYVDNLNNALKKYPQLQGRTIEAMLRDLNNVPSDIRNTVRNNGGGHLNHTMFWEIMSPTGGGQPTGNIAQEINKTFGSFDDFKKQFNAAGGQRFGSGWVWLVRNKQGQLQIATTANQDSPIMEGLYPILGNDVWEHAYYLRYQNRRADYLNSWWDVVNWNEVNRRAQVKTQA
ncbi:superoxide dismutase [Calothrix sp. NIES-4071]|nr:superoxide dismutase [Calothrix sp. NIES-4071]BAZ54813.1 superoxide dismutase [Calothrix sp. NIES-4105]